MTHRPLADAALILASSNTGGGRSVHSGAYGAAMVEDAIAVDDPRSEDVRLLLEQHLTFAHANSPPEDVHALDLDGLLDPSVTLYSFRRNGRLLAVGALKRLSDEHAELKSMHTAQEARRQGIARAMLEYLVAAARNRGFRRLSLETGTPAAFEPAHALYARAGFAPCSAFGDYSPSPNSLFLTLDLDKDRRVPDTSRGRRRSSRRHA